MPNNHSLQSENLAKLKEVLDKRYYGTSPFTNLDSTDEGKVIGVVKNRQGEYEAKPVSMNPASCPIGSIIAWPTPTIPVGFLVCNGQAVSRVSFKKLFDKIGITYGAGDGSTTFNVPDLRDKFIEGGNTSDSNLDTAIAAGLPNLTGSVKLLATGAGVNQNVRVYNDGSSGIITGNGPQVDNNYINTSAASHLDAKQVSGFSIDASKAGTDPVYGKSSTVQPPAVKMLYIICTGDSTPESIVDSMHLANTDGTSTIKFGKDNQGNYGYYKGDDPIFNRFINPGDISATYTELFSRNASTGKGTYTLNQSVNNFDLILVRTNNTSTPTRNVNNMIYETIIPPHDYGKPIGVYYVAGSLQWEVKVEDTTFTTYYEYKNCDSVAVYGVKFRAEVDPPTSMKLSTDLTKEIRFGQENGTNGYYVDDDTFIRFTNLPVAPSAGMTITSNSSGEAEWTSVSDNRPEDITSQCTWRSNISSDHRSAIKVGKVVYITCRVQASIAANSDIVTFPTGYTLVAQNICGAIAGANDFGTAGTTTTKLVCKAKSGAVDNIVTATVILA